MHTERHQGTKAPRHRGTEAPRHRNERKIRMRRSVKPLDHETGMTKESRTHPAITPSPVRGFALSGMRSVRLIAALLVLCGHWAPGALATEAPPCGDEGVWIQILGAGGPQLDDTMAASSYVVWLDDHARLLVDTAPGASVRFDEIGARFEDLDAIVWTHLHADHSADFAAFVNGSRFLERERPLTVLGPEGNEAFPDAETFVERMIGPGGAFPHLADFLTRQSSGGYRLRVWNVPAKGRKRWAGYGSEHMRLAAIPVHHGGVPTLAWRVEAAGKSIVLRRGLLQSERPDRRFRKGHRCPGRLARGAGNGPSRRQGAVRGSQQARSGRSPCQCPPCCCSATAPTAPAGARPRAWKRSRNSSGGPSYSLTTWSAGVYNARPAPGARLPRHWNFRIKGAKAMGKGDIRTKRGKITRGTFGVRRRKKSKKNAATQTANRPRPLA